MKKLILLFVLISSFSFGQEYKRIKEDEIIKSNASKFRGNIDEVELNNGLNIKIGDTLIINKPANTTKDNFAYLMYGTLDGSMLKGVKYVRTDLFGLKVILTKMKFMSSFGGTGIVAEVDPINQVYMNKYITVFNIVNAINLKELLTLGLTKDDALKLLEEKKKLLDLGLITEEDYEKIKIELKAKIFK